MNFVQEQLNTLFFRWYQHFGVIVKKTHIELCPRKHCGVEMKCDRYNQITVNITWQSFATTNRDGIKRHTLLAEQKAHKIGTILFLQNTN